MLNLKEDMRKRAAYLKYLKVSTKFIESCECPEPVHSYCLSALVTRTRKIQCNNCNEPFNYFIKKEKICNAKLLKLIIGYLLVFGIAMICTAGLIILDGWMKYKHAQDNPDIISELKEISSPDASIDQSDFTFWSAVRWNLLIPISIIILVILLWCFYFTYQDEIALRQRIVYVEVQARHQGMQRSKSK